MLVNQSNTHLGNWSDTNNEAEINTCSTSAEQEPASLPTSEGQALSQPTADTTIIVEQAQLDAIELNHKIQACFAHIQREEFWILPQILRKQETQEDSNGRYENDVGRARLFEERQFKEISA